MVMAAEVSLARGLKPMASGKGGEAGSWTASLNPADSARGRYSLRFVFSTRRSPVPLTHHSAWDREEGGQPGTMGWAGLSNGVLGRLPQVEHLAEAEDGVEDLVKVPSKTSPFPMRCRGGRAHWSKSQGVPAKVHSWMRLARLVEALRRLAGS